MREITIGGVKYTIPIIWSEVTVDQYQRLYRAKYTEDKVANYINMLAIICGIEGESLALQEYDPAAMVELDACVGFLTKPMDTKGLDYSLFECLGEKITFEAATAKNVSVGQAFAIREYFDKNKYQNMESAVSYAVAVYVAGAKRLSAGIIEKAEDEIKKLPIRDVYALAFFLSRKCLTVSRPGTTVTSTLKKIFRLQIARSPIAWYS